MFKPVFTDKHRHMVDIHCLMKQYDAKAKGEYPYALIQFNIKHFRYLNTRYGVKGGDEILQLVFDELDKWLSDHEYASHLYSDYFVLLVQCYDVDDLVYKRLMKLIDQIYRIKDERIYRNINLSMGIYQMKADTPFESALDYANLCRKQTEGIDRRSSSMEVYDAKHYDYYMNQMDLEIKTADAYKNYEFITYLQPKVDLNTEKIAGAEALLRWFDKEGKPIPLNDFLPILEENGYITLVDLDTFEQVCQYLEKRIKENKKVVPVSFNLSKYHFQNPNMVHNYISAFEKFNIPKNLIEIEFKESITFSDKERVMEVVTQLRDYGFSCALDDFGNGYSSFGVLLNAPLDTIKMDRQFFMDNLNGDSELVIKTVVELIHSLKMDVVAEGVESPIHIKWLKDCHCDYVQGYYYYKPMSLDEFSQVLDND